MKYSLLVFVLLLCGIHTGYSQEENNNSEISAANMSLLNQLVTSDYQKSKDKMVGTKKILPKKNSLVKASHQTLRVSNTDGKVVQNAKIYVIKDSKSKVVKTKPEENRALGADQVKALNAVLGVQN